MMSDKPEIIERVMDCKSGTPISKDGWQRPSGTWVGENDQVRFGDVDLHVRNITENPDHTKEPLQTLVGEGKGGHIIGIDEVEELPTTKGGTGTHAIVGEEVVESFHKNAKQQRG